MAFPRPRQSVLEALGTHRARRTELSSRLSALVLALVGKNILSATSGSSSAQLPCSPHSGIRIGIRVGSDGFGQMVSPCTERQATERDEPGLSP